ncbi:hypothetical protein F4778DRAFT_278242 [Xylariomycetidae sp. FL2044]|nr:hypothetical protein F4778DRAFT_278242 [Xylariomycetidae sp. FL2044]
MSNGQGGVESPNPLPVMEQSDETRRPLPLVFHHCSSVLSAPNPSLHPHHTLPYHPSASIASPQGSWPTPHSVSDSEERESYSFENSPVNGHSGIPLPAIHRTSYSSLDSPESQSPPIVPHSYCSTFWKAEDSSLHTMPGHTSTLYDSRYRQQMPSPMMYGTPILSLPADGDQYDSITRQDAPSLVSDGQFETGASSPEGSPEMGGEGYMSSGEAEEIGDIHPRNSCDPMSPSDEGLDENSARAEIPYAQLVWRALKSRPDFSMTLQEIYQWFRDYTRKDRANPGSKGWQNSIRHNLSMNDAFIKRERQTNDGKKISEWTLMHWAINGVQSTTRYRKAKPGRRAGAGGRARQSARANSGRRGGITASKTRAAATRRSTQSRFNSPSFTEGQQIALDNNFIYTHPPPHHFAHGMENEPVTPPDTSSSSMLWPTANPIHGTYESHYARESGYSYTANPPHVVPSQHPAYGPPPPPPTQHHTANPYSLADVTGVYEPQPASTSASASHIPGQHAVMPLFANAEELAAAVTEDRWANWNSSTNDGPYQS